MMVEGCMESTELELDVEIRAIMEGGGVLVFLEKFRDLDSNLATELAKSWDGSYVEANAVCFRVSKKAIANVMGLLPMGVKIAWEHHSLCRR